MMESTTVGTPAATEREFYKIGGTLPANAPSYVERRADADLLLHLSEGQFCYVLTSRQMGKSSLMVRTAARLRQQGGHVAILDLTKIGQNLSPEQWYYGLIIRLGQELDLEDELDDFWNSTDARIRKMGPLQRWMTALREVVLPVRAGKVVVFVDEIDAVRALPFPTDEFFAGIRELHNSRISEGELNRLAFCLLGVAKPSDLIRNIHTTPFNIGFRIELSDFTIEEAEALADGLSRPPELGRKLLKRVLYWTGGHPYLTQRLCAALAGTPEVDSNSGVDKLCDDLFLSSRAREKDDNLLFVRERILRSDLDRATLLDFYQNIRNRKKVADDDANPIIDVLRLSGIVRVAENHLVVRNGIYHYIFDHKWIIANMPDAELRRQKIAYRKGLIRSALVGAIVVAVVSWMGWRSYRLSQAIAQSEYYANMAMVQQAFDAGDYGNGVRLLRSWLSKVSRVKHGFEWNYLWVREYGESATSYLGHQGPVRSVATSPDGKLAVTAGADSTVRVFDISGCCAATAPDSNKLVAALELTWAGSGGGQDHAGDVLGSNIPVGQDPAWSLNNELGDNWLEDVRRGNLPGAWSATFSPDGAWIAIVSGRGNPKEVGTVLLWSTRNFGKVIPVSTGHSQPITVVTFPDAKTFRNAHRFATASWDNTAKFWRIGDNDQVTQDGQDLRLSRSSESSVEKTFGINSAAFSPDGSRFAVVTRDGRLLLYDLHSREVTNSVPETDVSGLVSVVFLNDDSILFGGKEGNIWVFDFGRRAGKPKVVRVRNVEQRFLTSLALSANGKHLVTAGSSATVKVWSIQRSQPGRMSLFLEDTLKGHRDAVLGAAMTPDRRVIVSGGADGEARFWQRSKLPSDGEVYSERPWSIFAEGSIRTIAFLPNLPDDEPKLAVLRANPNDAKKRDHLWLNTIDLESRGSIITRTQAHKSTPGIALALSPDSKYVATAGWDGSILLWRRHVWPREDRSILTLEGEPKVLHPADAKFTLAMAFSPDGDLAAAHGQELLVWRHDDVQADKVSVPLSLPAKGANSLRAVKFSPRGGFLASCGDGGKVYIWEMTDVAAGKAEPRALPGSEEKNVKAQGFSGVCTSVAFSSDGQLLAAGSTNRELFLWKTKDWTRTQRIEHIVGLLPSAWGWLHMIEHGDSNAGNGEGNHAWSPAVSEAINDLAFSPDKDNPLLAAATAEGKIQLWNVRTQDPLPSIAVHLGVVSTIAFSPKGDVIASGGSDQTVQFTRALPVPRITPRAERIKQPEAANWISYPAEIREKFQADK